MYRIVKRIVRTITTVTWLIRLENASSAEKSIEKEINFPARYVVTEEEVLQTNPVSKQIAEKSQPTLDQGEKS